MTSIHLIHSFVFIFANYKFVFIHGRAVHRICRIECQTGEGKGRVQKLLSGLSQTVRHI